MNKEANYTPYGSEWGDNQMLLRELIMRANLALPENEEDLVWFEEGVNAVKNPEFIERIFLAAGLGKLKIKR